MLMFLRAIFSLVIMCVPLPGMTLEYYIAQSGNDQFDGLSMGKTQLGTNGPFLTLGRAQQAIRDLKKNGQLDQPVTIHIQTGNYVLQKPLEFDLRDSGFEGRQITWKAEGGAVVISGGIALQNCAKDQDNPLIWSCATSSLPLDKIKYKNNSRKQGSAPGFELFINQKPLHLSRWPNTDWGHIKTPLAEKTTFDTFEQLPQLSVLSEAQVHIFAGNDWFDEYTPVSSIDSNLNQISLAKNTTYPLASGRRFYLENIQSLLDAPGEWFYDRLGNKISFIPLDNLAPKDIIISAQKNILSLNGANYITLKNLTFQYSTDVAIIIDKSNHVVIDGVEISNIGSRAIEAKNSNDIKVTNSLIHDTGEGGILLSGGDRNSLEASNNVVHNCHIHNFGRIILTYTPAIEVAGVGTSVTHNLVEQAPGTGILIHGNDHLIEKNEIHHVCEQASDCGGIYSGREWTYRGNIIRNNSIHDLFGYGLKNINIATNTIVYGKSDGVRGVYLDDFLSGFTVTGNLFNNAGAMSIQMAGGRDNIIENNVIKTDSYAIWADNRPATTEVKKRFAQAIQNTAWIKKYPKLSNPITNQDWPEGNSLQRNIIITSKPGGLSLRYSLPKQNNIIANNLTWSTTGQFSVDYNILDGLAKRGGAPWQEWLSQGFETGSSYADPCVTITANKVSFCQQSPIKQIGFQPIPADIGLLK